MAGLIATVFELERDNVRRAIHYLPATLFHGLSLGEFERIKDGLVELSRNGMSFRRTRSHSTRMGQAVALPAGLRDGVAEPDLKLPGLSALKSGLRPTDRKGQEARPNRAGDGKATVPPTAPRTQAATPGSARPRVPSPATTSPVAGSVPVLQPARPPSGDVPVLKPAKPPSGDVPVLKPAKPAPIEVPVLKPAAGAPPPPREVPVLKPLEIVAAAGQDLEALQGEAPSEAPIYVVQASDLFAVLPLPGGSQGSSSFRLIVYPLETTVRLVAREIASGIPGVRVGGLDALAEGREAELLSDVSCDDASAGLDALLDAEIPAAVRRRR